MGKTKIILFTVLILFFSKSIFPFFVGNYSEKGFLPGSTITTFGSNNTSSIKQYIIEGGGYYLESYSDFLLFLQKVENSELNGFNYEESFQVVQEAVKNLENARAIYVKLTKLAIASAYDQRVIDLLVSFDYESFMTQTNCNWFIFKKVENFLSKGDIRGTYARIYKDVDMILGQLKKIRTSLCNGDFPKLENIWRIHQNYSDSILFGQYIAQVFYKI